MLALSLNYANLLFQISLMPPQFYILTSLAAILSGDVSTPKQRDAVTRLALGWFGRLMINPRALPEKDGQGLVILTYEGDEARGGQVGARHRVHVRSSKGVVSANRLTLELYNQTLTNIQMQVVVFERNIDIFSEVPIESSKDGPKL